MEGQGRVAKVAENQDTNENRHGVVLSGSREEEWEDGEQREEEWEEESRGVGG